MTRQPVSLGPALRLTQRQVMIALLGLMLGISAVVLVIQLASGATMFDTVSTGVSLVSLSAVLFFYLRGWEYARHLTIVLVTALIALTTTGIYLTEQFSITTFIPPVVALIAAGPGWVVASAAAVYLSLLVRSGFSEVYTQPFNILLFILIIGGMLLARLITDTALHTAEANAARAEEALIHAEAQKATVAQKAEELLRQNEEQRRLIDLVATLEVPAVTIADGVLLAPVVGHLDSRRAAGLTDRLLHEVNSSRARLVILDIAGVPAVDTAVAQALLRAIQAVRLLGCDVAITGITASIAATMTQLGISMAGVRTARTPQEALGQTLTAGVPLNRN